MHITSSFVDIPFFICYDLLQIVHGNWSECG